MKDDLNIENEEYKFKDPTVYPPNDPRIKPDFNYSGLGPAPPSNNLSKIENNAVSTPDIDKPVENNNISNTNVIVSE